MTANDITEKVDVLCIGAHEDDIDYTVGGTVALLTSQGYRVHILDLTVREGMYFSEEEERDREAQKAANILGVTRSNLDLGLLKLENTYENRVRIADEIRRMMPDVLITLDADESHPDHHVAHQLVLDAWHCAYSTAIETQRQPWYVKGVYFTHLDRYEPMPKHAMYIDISEVAEKKWEAMMSYASQCLYHGQNKKYVLDFIKSLNRSWGAHIRKDYAEKLIPRTPILTHFPELKRK